MPFARGEKLWKAEEVLPEPTLKCQGNARSKGRRCTQPIGKKRIKHYYEILDQLSRLKLADAAKSQLLFELADERFCYHHANEADPLAKRWIKVIEQAEQEELRKRKEQAKRANSNANFARRTSPASYGNARASSSNGQSSRPAFRQRMQTPVEYGDDGYYYEEPPFLERRPQRGFPRAPVSPPRTPPEARQASPPAVGTMHLFRATIESPDDETDEYYSDEDDEDDITDEELPWREYTGKWAELQDNGLTRGMPLEYQIPWPVLSGRCQDVTIENVNEFYDMATEVCDHDMDGSLNMMHIERSLWVPHNLREIFGRDICKGIYRLELKRIRQVVEQRIKDLRRTMTG